MNERHKRSQFESGNSSLDAYLKQRASQDARRRIAVPYVVADDDGNVLGYYTLTSTSIDIGELPPDIAKKLPGHGVILGATLIGRLAVDRRYQGQDIGALLVADALDRALLQNPAGTIAVIVDALTDEATRFYQKLGFTLLPDNPRTLFFMRASLGKRRR
jgi:GNAT superfamily N-acetyltransferase